MIVDYLEVKDCQKQSKETGYIIAIDGRKLVSRSPHSALNLLLQGSAGVVAKKWMVNYHELAATKGMPHKKDWGQCAFIHDEFQCTCIESKASALGDILVEGCNMIQKQFNMALPIEADFVIGDNWAQTH